MGQTDLIIGSSTQPTGKLRICRTPGCLIAFDPAWRVRITNEPAECEFLCPRCGADLTRNSFIRRAQDEVGVQEEV